MILSIDEISQRLFFPDQKDPLIIVPQPDKQRLLEEGGSASIDLRLGTWFLAFRQTRLACLRHHKQEIQHAEPIFSSNSLEDYAHHHNVHNRLTETEVAKSYYVPFDKEFILHPKTFVLGVTLEWIRLPKDLCGFVVGKSSWGRTGLNIATAAGVHPEFTGCLTLELSNLGEVPLAIKPGWHICQIFLNEVISKREDNDISRKRVKRYDLNRKPIIERIQPDETAKKLCEVYLKRSTSRQALDTPPSPAGT